MKQMKLIVALMISSACFLTYGMNGTAEVVSETEEVGADVDMPRAIEAEDIEYDEEVPEEGMDVTGEEEAIDVE